MLIGKQLLAADREAMSGTWPLGPKCAIVSDNNVARDIRSIALKQSLTSAGFRPTLDHDSGRREIEDARSKPARFASR